jgi:hypothetical protein
MESMACVVFGDESIVRRGVGEETELICVAVLFLETHGVPCHMMEIFQKEDSGIILREVLVGIDGEKNQKCR